MSKKNLGKKHHFVHRDPEQEGIAQIQEKTAGAFDAEKVTSKKEKVVEKPQDPKTQIAISDFKKNLIVIGIFIAIIAAFYLIQEKTSVLKPILNYFNI